MAFTVERTLEHNDYINEVGQRRRQVMKRTSENYQEEESIDSSKSNQSNYSLRKRRYVNYNEEKISTGKRQHQDRETTPSPCNKDSADEESDQDDNNLTEVPPKE